MTAPLIVTATFAPAHHAMLDGLRRTHFPASRNQLAAHLTLFHHLPPSVEDELLRRLSTAAREGAPEAALAGVMDLGGGTALRVRSEGLVALRAELAHAFADLLVPQDRAGWRPHVTIQNKVPRAAAVALQAELAGRFDDRPLALRGLAAWRYLGGPWELVAETPFRGRAG